LLFCLTCVSKQLPEMNLNTCPGVISPSVISTKLLPVIA
jgi:hypothetical protein